MGLKGCAVQVAREYTGRPAFTAAIEVTGDDVWVSADPVRLAQEVDKLVENAVKYGARRIVLRTEREAASGVLTVTDDGQGVLPELLPRLFEPFVQGEQTLERTKGGLGLGLALVRRLATLQGGTVEVRSGGVGRGSAFTVRLPAAAPPVVAHAPVPTGPGRKRRVLVVEDNADARESLRELLRGEGHEVAAVGDAREALHALERFRPDVAFVDVGLPGMNGYELGQRMRAACRAGIVLVALTGYGADADRRAAFAAGFDLHLTKPVPFAELQEALGALRCRKRALDGAR